MKQKVKSEKLKVKSKKDTSKGFTLIELLVVMFIFSFIVGGILTVFINNQHTKQFAEAITEAQQSARLSSQILTTDMRSIGYKIDVENKQIFIEYGGPYDIVFNADIKPYPDTSATPGYPQAINPLLSPNAVGPSGSPYYQPGMQYETGAETYRYTLDYNDDGSINSTDRSSDPIANSTQNPNDYMLIRRIYGALSGGTSNGGSIQQIALVRGPDQYPNQLSTTIYPLFTYWYDRDNDPSTPLALWGDNNGDSTLNAAEIANLQPIVNINILKRIQRITVTVTAETRYPDRRGHYNRVVIKTDVTPGNVAKPIRMIMGHVYNDANHNGLYDGGESGISHWKVWLNTGDAATTDANGIYTFSVPASVYRIMTQPQVGWTPTTAVSKEVNTDTGDVHLETDTIFGFKTTPTGWVRGFVYADSTAQPCEYDPDSGDVPMDSIPVYGSNFSGTTDDTGYYYIQVNAAPNTSLVEIDTLSGVCIDTIDTLGGGTYADYFPIPGNKDKMKFVVQPNDTAEVNFYRKKAYGIPCTTHLYIPNGGELWSIGDTNNIIYWVNGIDDRIDTVNIRYSYDNGAAGTWRYIGYKNIGVDSVLDTFAWDIDTSYTPTFDALIKVVAYDSGGNICFDASDSVFTLIAPWGYPTLYFKRQWVNDTTIVPWDTVVTDQGISSDFMRYLSPRPPVSGSAESLAVALAETTLTSGLTIGSHGPYLRYWNPDSAWAQWISKKWSPYRESIPPDTWKFYLWAQSYAENSIGQRFDILQAPTIKINKVSKRDSLGTPASDTTLFFFDRDPSVFWASGDYKAINYASSPPVTTLCTLVKQDTLSHTMQEDSVYIYVPVAFKVKRWNRIVVEIWFDPSTLTLSLSSDMPLKSYFYSNTIDFESRIDVPHY